MIPDVDVDTQTMVPDGLGQMLALMIRENPE